ncbi:MAG TPA: YkgJ family cysteine cluster protein [Phycisphaerales bacterium]|nr:YkgJ family cysteine cluster protein [Phycisphaerales bacterium]HRQ74406.1 YkgJ family cysteine cluster protein [Phycisphaerales bacterium]
MADQSSSSRAQEWYADGLRFTCTQCGNCCTGPPGAVWFVEEEGSALAKLLGIDEREFYSRYARRLDGRWSLNEQLTSHGYDCIFLERSNGRAGCSVYEARPMQCRTWPFWPEMLESKRAWAAAKRRTPCPGMDSGKLIPIEQIRIQRDRTPAD